MPEPHTAANSDNTSQDDINQYLLTNRSEYSALTQNLFVQGSEFVGFLSLYGLIYDQPFYISGDVNPEVSSVSIGALPIGNGCDVRVSIWTDNDGLPGEELNLTYWPEEWWACSAPTGLPTSGNIGTAPQFNTILVSNWGKVQSSSSGSPSYFSLPSTFVSDPTNQLTTSAKTPGSPYIYFAQAGNSFLMVGGGTTKSASAAASVPTANTQMASVQWQNTTFASWQSWGNFPKSLLSSSMCVTPDGCVVVVGGISGYYDIYTSIGPFYDGDGYGDYTGQVRDVFIGAIDGTGQISNWQGGNPLPAIGCQLGVTYAIDGLGKQWIIVVSGGVGPDVYGSGTGHYPGKTSIWRAPYSNGQITGNWESLYACPSIANTNVTGDYGDIDPYFLSNSLFGATVCQVGNFLYVSGTNIPPNWWYDWTTGYEIQIQTFGGAYVSPISTPTETQVEESDFPYHLQTIEYYARVPENPQTEWHFGQGNQNLPNLPSISLMTCPSPIGGNYALGSLYGSVVSADGLGIILGPWPSYIPWAKYVGGYPNHGWAGRYGATVVGLPPIHQIWAFSNGVSNSWQLVTYAPAGPVDNPLTTAYNFYYANAVPCSVMSGPFPVNPPAGSSFTHTLEANNFYHLIIEPVNDDPANCVEIALTQGADYGGGSRPEIIPVVPAIAAMCPNTTGDLLTDRLPQYVPPIMHYGAVFIVNTQTSSIAYTNSLGTGIESYASISTDPLTYLNAYCQLGVDTESPSTHAGIAAVSAAKDSIYVTDTVSETIYCILDTTPEGSTPAITSDSDDEYGYTWGSREIDDSTVPTAEQVTLPAGPVTPFPTTPFMWNTGGYSSEYLGLYCYDDATLWLVQNNPVSFTLDCTADGTDIVGIPTTFTSWVGFGVTGSGVSGGTTVLSFDYAHSTLTLSASVSTTGSVELTFHPSPGIVGTPLSNGTMAPFPWVTGGFTAPYGIVLTSATTGWVSDTNALIPITLEPVTLVGNCETDSSSTTVTTTGTFTGSASAGDYVIDSLGLIAPTTTVVSVSGGAGTSIVLSQTPIGSSLSPDDTLFFQSPGSAAGTPISLGFNPGYFDIYSNIAWVTDLVGKKIWPVDIDALTVGSPWHVAGLSGGLCISADGSTAWCCVGDTIVPATLSDGSIGTAITLASGAAPSDCCICSIPYPDEEILMGTIALPNISQTETYPGTENSFYGTATYDNTVNWLVQSAFGVPTTDSQIVAVVDYFGTWYQTINPITGFAAAYGLQLSTSDSAWVTDAGSNELIHVALPTISTVDICSTTASSNTVTTIQNFVTAGVNVGDYLIDVTNPGNIPSGTTVTSISPYSITISADAVNTESDDLFIFQSPGGSLDIHISLPFQPGYFDINRTNNIAWIADITDEEIWPVNLTTYAIGSPLSVPGLNGGLCVDQQSGTTAWCIVSETLVPVTIPSGDIGTPIDLGYYTSDLAYTTLPGTGGGGPFPQNATGVYFTLGTYSPPFKPDPKIGEQGTNISFYGTVNKNIDTYANVPYEQLTMVQCDLPDNEIRTIGDFTTDSDQDTVGGIRSFGYMDNDNYRRPLSFHPLTLIQSPLSPPSSSSMPLYPETDLYPEITLYPS